MSIPGRARVVAAAAAAALGAVTRGRAAAIGSQQTRVRTAVVVGRRPAARLG